MAFSPQNPAGICRTGLSQFVSSRRIIEMELVDNAQCLSSAFQIGSPLRRKKIRRKVGRSFLQARAAMRYRFIISNPAIISVADIDAHIEKTVHTRMWSSHGWNRA